MKRGYTYAARFIFIAGGNISAFAFATQAGPDAGAQFVFIGGGVLCLAMFPPTEILFGAYGIVAGW